MKASPRPAKASAPLAPRASRLGLDSFLIVRVGTERYGLPLHEVREVVDLLELPAPRPVPSSSPALRGLLSLRDRFLSLAHLGALLTGGAPPEQMGEMAAVVAIGEVRVALEVDEILAVVDRGAEPVGSAPENWARGIWRVAPDLITVLDLAKVHARMTGTDSHG